MTQSVARTARTRNGNNLPPPGEPDAARVAARLLLTMKAHSVSASSNPMMILSVRIAPGGTAKLIGERVIGAGDSEHDQDRQRDPMPMQGERRL